MRMETSSESKISWAIPEGVRTAVRRHAFETFRRMALVATTTAAIVTPLGLAATRYFQLESYVKWLIVGGMVLFPLCYWALCLGCWVDWYYGRGKKLPGKADYAVSNSGIDLPRLNRRDHPKLVWSELESWSIKPWEPAPQYRIISLTFERHRPRIVFLPGAEADDQIVSFFERHASACRRESYRS